MTFGQRVRELRKAKGFTIYEVADAIGRDYTYISKFETDRCLPPSADVIVTLATLLGADAEELGTLGNKPPVAVLRQRLADIMKKAQTVVRIWDHLARCEDEFLPEDPSACGEYRDELDTAILALMRVADPERWEGRQQAIRDFALPVPAHGAGGEQGAGDGGAVMLQVGHIAVKQNGRMAYYRGVLRRDGAIIWECPHEHKWGTSAARHCAENYVAEIGEHEPATPTGEAAAGEEAG